MKGLADFLIAKRQTAAFVSFAEDHLFAIRLCILKTKNVASLRLLSENTMSAFINVRIATLVPLWANF